MLSKGEKTTLYKKSVSQVNDIKTEIRCGIDFINKLKYKTEN